MDHKVQGLADKAKSTGKDVREKQPEPDVERELHVRLKRDPEGPFDVKTGEDEA